MINNWKGIPIPEAGDSLLESYAAGFNKAGVIQRVDSIAAARTALASAEAKGLTPSEAAPAYFDIGSLLYRSVGVKNASGAFTLQAMNEVQANEQMTTTAGTITMSAGSQRMIITSTLPVAPYPRAVFAWGMASATVKGICGLRLLILNRDGQTARWEDNSAMESRAVFNMGVIPAGVNPDIILAMSFGGTGNSTITFSSAADANRLMVLAFPTDVN